MQIDLSTLPPPNVVNDISFEAVLASLRADLISRLPAIAPTLQLESAVVNQVLQVCAYREVVLRSRINDAARAVMLAFARGTDLDQLAAIFGVERMTRVSETNVTTIEEDERFRRRIQMALDAHSTAGAEEAYIFHALTADLRVADAVAIGQGSELVEPGTVIVSILCDDDGDADVQTEIIAAVRERLFSKKVKPLTVTLRLQAAAPQNYSINAVLKLRRGPDPQIVLQEAKAKLQAYLSSRHKVARRHARSGIYGALHTGSVENVILTSPVADVDPGEIGIAVPTIGSITWEYVDD